MASCVWCSSGTIKVQNKLSRPPRPPLGISRWRPTLPPPWRAVEINCLLVPIVTKGVSLKNSHRVNSCVKWVVTTVKMMAPPSVWLPSSLNAGLSQAVSTRHLHLLSPGIPSHKVTSLHQYHPWTMLVTVNWFSVLFSYALRNSLDKESRPACDRCSRDFKQYGTVVLNDYYVWETSSILIISRTFSHRSASLATCSRLLVGRNVLGAHARERECAVSW